MVDRVVLYVQLPHPETLGQARGADERREAGMEAGPRLPGDREQLTVAPQVARPRLDQVAREQFARDAIVVHDLQRTQALLADPESLGRVLRRADVTSQAAQRRH